MEKDNDQPKAAEHISPRIEPPPSTSKDQIIGVDESPIEPQNSADDCKDETPPDDPGKPKIELTRGEWISVAIMLVMVAQSIIYYWTFAEVRRTAGAAQDQANTAQKQFEVTDRPWLSIEVDPSGPLLFGNTPNLTVKYVVKNVGRSVATGVTVNGQVFIPVWGDAIFKEPTKRQNALCEKLTDSGGISVTIFPNETKELGPASFALDPQEVKEHQIEKTGMIEPILVGCVDYTFGGQSSHHQTGFIYEAHVLDPAKDPAHPYGIKVGQDVPVDKLILIKYFFGGDYAN